MIYCGFNSKKLWEANSRAFRENNFPEARVCFLMLPRRAWLKHSFLLCTMHIVLPISMDMIPLFLLKVFIECIVFTTDHAEEEYISRALFQESLQWGFFTGCSHWAYFQYSGSQGEVHSLFHAIFWWVTQDQLGGPAGGGPRGGDATSPWSWSLVPALLD